ncbi:HAD-IA family hydrolase [Pseudoflavonifractor phocaeensis]|uniref:HAD family hydrolase n=1 Tax=Pseudoflavonifractor phocaeensis TaxID=1870988 RepID=UPI00195AC036|nr:HAD-IA family hydrolase [Pseudoflavonifractor phocaeensis]MBM6938757.1 HAD-IA family hydrolase [Pseudoflavonifractor phocaeensis]
MDYRAVLFDFDFTLADASEAIVAGFRHGFAVMGHPEPRADAVRATIGLPLEDAYTLLSGDGDPDRRKEFRGHFSQVAVPMQIEVTKLFPGAEDLLRALKAAGIPAAIVSTKRADTLCRVLQKRNLLELLTAVTGSEMVQKQKPDPEGLCKTIAGLGLAPDQVLYCGDTVIDAEAAQRAGAHFCAVLNGTTGREAFAPFPADYIADDLNALRVWLGL